MNLAGEKEESLATRLYFRLKPFLPKAVRWSMRRRWANSVRVRSSGVWPVDESSATPPEGWRGWPEGKRFALVLTHDVEGGEGLSKVRQLAELELEHGLCSSFNFVPEGSYSVPDTLRNWLEGNRFEVGVHDLNHDGHLYDSRINFSAKAKRINSYLRKWQACGFRSGFMLRRMSWLHELDLCYDSSTFDTDPFEPQPGGCGTVFPFFVEDHEKGGGSGYVELPYTLPQDSSMFLLLGEEGPKIWLEKLDWIAEKGAMALVNIHPDYVDFEGGSGKSSYHYPVRWIEEFFAHLESRFHGEYWNPLARDLAGWFRKEKSANEPAGQRATTSDTPGVNS